MKIKYMAFVMTLLITILAISALPGYIEPVKASEASANWYSYEGWPDEISVSQDVVYYIFLKFNSLDYEWKMYSDQYTTAYNINSVANSMDTYDYASLFLYSHGATRTVYGYYDLGEYQVPVPVEHFYSFMGPLHDASYDDLFDTDVGYTNEDGGYHFVFMWECASAKIQGYYDYDTYQYIYEYGWVWYYGTGPVGWAKSWTTVYGLNGDGYSYPDETAYAFIGFADYSPPLTGSTGYSDKTYADFLTAFYDKALQTYDRKTINQALDYAANQAFDQDYIDTPLYLGWTAYLPPPADFNRDTSMRVFGNGNNYLSIG